jgi:predicted enzyme related to lactoylglutathione lyase
LIVYPVKDIAKAKTFYSKFLGVDPYVDSPYYVGYKVGNIEIGLDPNAEVGPITYTDVDDIKASLKSMTEAGAEVAQSVSDVGNGLLIAHLQDTNGNIVGLRQQT